MLPQETYSIVSRISNFTCHVNLFYLLTQTPNHNPTVYCNKLLQDFGWSKHSFLRAIQNHNPTGDGSNTGKQSKHKTRSTLVTLVTQKRSVTLNKTLQSMPENTESLSKFSDSQHILMWLFVNKNVVPIYTTKKPNIFMYFRSFTMTTMVWGVFKNANFWIWVSKCKFLKMILLSSPCKLQQHNFV